MQGPIFLCLLEKNPPAFVHKGMPIITLYLFPYVFERNRKRRRKECNKYHGVLVTFQSLFQKFIHVLIYICREMEKR